MNNRILKLMEGKQNEDAIQVRCTQCAAKKILLDCEDVWEDAKPKLKKCPTCGTCGYGTYRRVETYSRSLWS